MAKRVDRMLRKLSGGGAVKRPEYARRMQMTLAEWVQYYYKEIHFKKVRWMGHGLSKNVMDAWIIQEIMHEVQPDVVVELGCHRGGSSLYFAHLLDLIGKGELIAVDHNLSVFEVSHPRIIALEGDITTRAFAVKIEERCKGKKVLFDHDARHDKESVLDALRRYSHLVSPGSYFIVEDGIVDLFDKGFGPGWYDPGPLAAIEEFLQENGEFEADESREVYLLTDNPKGYLRRKMSAAPPLR